MEENVSFSTHQAYRPHFDALARAGFFKLVPKPTSTTKHVLHSIYRVIVWIIVLTYNLQHFIRVVQFRHSTDQVVNTLFILLTTLSGLGKQLAFNLRSQEIEHIISIIDVIYYAATLLDKTPRFSDSLQSKATELFEFDMGGNPLYRPIVIAGPVFAAKNRYHEQVMQSSAATHCKLLRFYTGYVLVSCLMWAIFPLVNRAQGLEAEFTGYMPFDTSTSPAFELTVAYLNFFLALQGYGNITMDCTIVALYAQAKVQLQILRYNLEHLADNNDSEENIDETVKKDIMHNTLKYHENDKFNSNLHQQKFIECVTRHVQIKSFIKQIETTFAEAMLFQFFVSAWVICMTVYKIVGMNLLSAELFSMAMYLGCMLFQLFIYCYYGTQVMYESEFLNQSIYCGDWMSLSPAFRRQLIVMMEICKRPITPYTAYIIPITLDTFIAVLRASYTLFTFLDRKSKT